MKWKSNLFTESEEWVKLFGWLSKKCVSEKDANQQMKLFHMSKAKSQFKFNCQNHSRWLHRLWRFQIELPKCYCGPMCCWRLTEGYLFVFVMRIMQWSVTNNRNGRKVKNLMENENSPLMNSVCNALMNDLLSTDIDWKSNEKSHDRRMDLPLKTHNRKTIGKSKFKAYLHEQNFPLSMFIERKIVISHHHLKESRFAQDGSSKSLEWKCANMFIK